MSEFDKKGILYAQDSTRTSHAANNSTLLTVPRVEVSQAFRFLRIPGAFRSGVVESSPQLDHTPFIIDPSDEFRSINKTSLPPAISINGMNMTDEAIRKMGQDLSNFFGKSILVIPNHTEGVPIDIRNCIASAFSNRNGFRYEPDAAQNLLHVLLERRNDSLPIEINAYSQGTLITYNVLNELKSFLTKNDQADLWNSLAERIELRTYGAAIHRWPSEINVRELRHLSDPVSVIGDIISFKKGITDLLNLSFESSRAQTTVLHESRNPHSISRYVENGPAFILKETGRNGFKEQADILIDSMKRGEFSNKTYGDLISLLYDKATTSSENPVEANKSILLSRELVLRLSKDPAALQILTRQSIEHLENASQSELKSVSGRFRTK